MLSWSVKDMPPSAAADPALQHRAPPPMLTPIFVLEKTPMRLTHLALLGVASSASLLAGCAAPPLGPLVQVIPAPGKPYGQFVAEDNQCRATASNAVAGQAQIANNRAIGGAVLSTALGAGLGAIVGGGRGAAVGSVAGAGIGTGFGASTSTGAQGGIQAQYDTVYAQCMYASGNQLPGIAPVVAYQPAAYAAPGPNPLVRDIQLELGRRRYYNGPPDGIDGPGTTQAIQAYQQAHGLPPDGAPSPYLLDSLRATPVGY